jgi:hypothetical protein
MASAPPALLGCYPGRKYSPLTLVRGGNTMVRCRCSDCARGWRGNPPECRRQWWWRRREKENWVGSYAVSVPSRVQWPPVPVDSEISGFWDFIRNFRCCFVFLYALFDKNKKFSFILQFTRRKTIYICWRIQKQSKCIVGYGLFLKRYTVWVRS